MKRSPNAALNERVTFQQPKSRDPNEPDYGETYEGWQDVFTVPARLKPRMGSETVIASRLQGVQPYNLIVHSSRQSRLVTPAWRVKNARSNDVYNIKSVINPDETNQYLEMLVVNEGGK